MTENTVHNYMTAALDAAKAAAARGEVPIGAVLVDSTSGQIVARNGNRTLEYSDPSAHAEMLCVRAACAQTGAQRIPGHTLYVTLEPCPMCTAALAYARIQHVVFGARDAKSGGLLSGPALAESKAIHHNFNITEGICAEEGRGLLTDFFRRRR
jgi:cytidine deaminase